MKFCKECHQPIMARLSACREYCGDKCQRAARKRRQERDSFGLFLAAQRSRVRSHLSNAVQAYRRRQAAAQEDGGAYAVEQRGYTFGGSPTREQFQEQD